MPGELPPPAADPIAALSAWLDDARDAGVDNPTAMTLATVDADGRPDARVVLLRGLDEHGIEWFTNGRSPKARQTTDRPDAALVFHWRELQRQVRVRGRVEPVADTRSDEYFAGRARRSQLSAWASSQSEPVADRAALESAMADAEERFAGRDVPRPPHWGGYRLVPDVLEFWIGRRDRLHDRRAFTRTPDGWASGRLQP